MNRPLVMVSSKAEKVSQNGSNSKKNNRINGSTRFLLMLETLKRAIETEFGDDCGCLSYLSSRAWLAKRLFQLPLIVTQVNPTTCFGIIVGQVCSKKRWLRVPSVNTRFTKLYQDGATIKHP